MKSARGASPGCKWENFTSRVAAALFVCQQRIKHLRLKATSSRLTSNFIKHLLEGRGFTGNPIHSCAIPGFDLGAHTLDLSGRKFVLRRDADGFQLLVHAAGGFLAARRLQRLPHPLGNGHVARSRRPLDRPIFQILQDEL